MSNNISVREFFKRFREELDTRRSSTPIILLEFETSGRRGTFQSRIAIYDLSTKDRVQYRYTSEDYAESSRGDWTLRGDRHKILRIVKPKRSLISSRRRDFGLIQVSDRDD